MANSVFIKKLFSHSHCFKAAVFRILSSNCEIVILFNDPKCLFENTLKFHPVEFLIILSKTGNVYKYVNSDWHIYRDNGLGL